MDNARDVAYANLARLLDAKDDLIRDRNIVRAAMRKKRGEINNSLFATRDKINNDANIDTKKKALKRLPVILNSSDKLREETHRAMEEFCKQERKIDLGIIEARGQIRSGALQFGSDLKV